MEQNSAKTSVDYHKNNLKNEVLMGIYKQLVESNLLTEEEYSELFNMVYNVRGGIQYDSVR